MNVFVYPRSNQDNGTWQYRLHSVDTRPDAEFRCSETGGWYREDPAATSYHPPSHPPLLLLWHRTTTIAGLHSPERLAQDAAADVWSWLRCLELFFSLLFLLISVFITTCLLFSRQLFICVMRIGFNLSNFIYTQFHFFLLPAPSSPSTSSHSPTSSLSSSTQSSVCQWLTVML